MTWHGTPDEAAALLAAVSHACGCQHEKDGTLVAVCSAHTALSTDQRFLDGVLWMHRMAAQLIQEERDVTQPTEDTQNAQIAQLSEQEALTVKLNRLILQGKWDDARVYIDAIDPANAGTWQNVPFPAGQ